MMGSTTYAITRQEYREWTRDEALQRGLAYGARLLTLLDALPREEPTWVEVQLSIQALAPGASVGWDPVFLLRLLDEGIVSHAKQQPLPPFDHQTSPLCLHYGGHDVLWDPDFGINLGLPSMLWVAEVEHHPASRSDASQLDSESAEVTLFVPHRLVPGLASQMAWTANASPSRDAASYHADRENKRPRALPIYLLEPDLLLDDDSVRHHQEGFWHELTTADWGPRLRDVDWTPEGHALLVNDRGLFQLSPDFSTVTPREHPELDLSARALACNPDGSLWLGKKDGLTLLHPDGTFVHYTEEDGLISRYIKALYRGRDETLCVVTARGVTVRHPDGTMKSIPTEYEDVFALDSQHRVWTGSKWHLTCHALDGTAQSFGEDEGLDAPLQTLIPLPDRTMLLGLLSKETKLIPDTGEYANPHPLLCSLAPEGIRCGAVAPDHTLWLVTHENHLLALRHGQTPQLLNWSVATPKHRHRAEVFFRIKVAPDGSLWLFDSQGVAVLRQETLARATAQPPANAEWLDTLQGAHFHSPQ